MSLVSTFHLRVFVFLFFNFPKSIPMRDEIANLVHPLLMYGVDLKERLDRGEDPNLETEQAQLKGLLLSESEARRHHDFGGEGDAGQSMVSVLGATRGSASGPRAPDTLLRS